MEFIITGATGFLGKEVTKKALNEGHKVYAVTRDAANAKSILGQQPNLEFLKIEDISKINCKRVIHLAWADVQNYNDDKNLAENAEVQKSFLKAFEQAGVNDITIAGTCLEYGMVNGACSEDSAPAELASQYAKAKYESYLQFQQLKNIKLKWLRCFYTYGPGQRANSLYQLVMKAIDAGQTEFNMSEGDQKRDYSNIDTLTHNILAAAEQNEVTGIINLGSGKPTTVLEFIESLLKLKAHKMKLNRGVYGYAAHEPKEFWADIEKLKKVKNARFDKDIWL